MHKSTTIAAASISAWLAVAAGCEPELGEDATAAANAVSVVSTGAGNGGAGAGDQGGGGAGASGGDGGAGGAGGVHGCSVATATDRTGQATVLINDISPWDFNHQACVRVDAGTTVRWETSSFALHPLTGGVAPTSDAASPISNNTVVENGATDFVEITFPATGEFPYFCVNHASSMQGVIYVEGTGAGGGGGSGGGGNGGTGGT